ncbi:immobilization antigen (macronuclear) [Tetrahymena thermophila SB210]|uniref:Immobilization antigen n=1 Tax=Tetrahymena thermophila (strain SB210) TaxID=312017 RepID=I7LW81_TETTS|nr:immobilization antigen [Tetrahymena thermophila SB210]EAS01132.1 immobilization antigen [Tetrahymena thermophila SB210]|eukprot:XP_001021377.1 immobilization antigen [Tetrahymena thermophila SB210]
MNKQLVILSLLLIASFTTAQGQQQQPPPKCAQNASPQQGNCICNPGYWGTNANQGGSCTQCASNTWSAPGTTNTGPSVTAVSACQACALGYYVTVQGSSSSSSPTCTPCGTNSSPAQPQAGSSVQKVSSCNSCMPGYYMTSVANAAVGSEAAAQCSACDASAGATPSAPPQAVGDLSSCNACQPGYFMTTAANVSSKAAAVCSKCPSNSMSQQQTQVGDVSACKCFDPFALPLGTSQKTCACKSSSETPMQAPGGATGCSAPSFGKLISFSLAIISFILLI